MGLQRTLNKSLILPVLLLVFASVAIAATVTHQVANARLEQRVQDLAESSAVHIESLVWQLDHETLQILLDEYVALGVVSSASVAAGAPVTALAGVDPGTFSYRLRRDLVRTEQGTSRQIGVMNLTKSRSGVLHLVIISSLVTFLVSSLLVLAVTMIIQRLLSKRLVAPMLTIAHSLNDWQGNWQQFEIDLGRNRQHKQDKTDELDQVVDSIHHMRDQLLTARLSIESRDLRLLSAARIAGIGYASFVFESGEIIECDENFSGIFGLSVDAMLGLSIKDDILRKRLHADDLERGMEIRQQLILGNDAEGIFRVVSDNGEYRHIRQLYSLAPGVEGQASQVLTVAQDVTELYRLQSTLVHAQRTRAIGNLTGGVAHDFNNILAVISGNLEMLEDEPLDTPIMNRVRTCLRAVEHGAELTHQLLAFARKQPLQPEVVNPSQLVRESLSLLRTTVGESIDLEVVTDGGLWRVDADKTQLEAAILNLVINARDAMHEGGKLTIDVSNARLDRTYAAAHEEVEPGQYVCIAVSDTGCGMSATTISQSLEPFFTTKGVGEGTGLGLSMAFGFMKQSGGHLKIYSEIDRGTTVKMYMPRLNGSQDVVRSEVVRPVVARFNGIQVLLVEDNDELRETFDMQLRKMGATVHSAFDGQQAFDLAPGVAHIDLVLCDVILPNGMKGPDVVAGLKKFYPETAVIYMSGYTENAIIHQGRLDDGVVMLQKPFTKNDLMAAYARASEDVGKKIG